MGGKAEGAWLPEALICPSQALCDGREINVYLLQPLTVRFPVTPRGVQVLANLKVNFRTH